jgi:hypothetical protein
VEKHYIYKKNRNRVGIGLSNGKRNEIKGWDLRGHRTNLISEKQKNII